MCAGVIAARFFGLCRTGVAYNANLAGKQDLKLTVKHLSNCIEVLEYQAKTKLRYFR